MFTILSQPNFFKMLDNETAINLGTTHSSFGNVLKIDDVQWNMIQKYLFPIYEYTVPTNDYSLTDQEVVNSILCLAAGKGFKQIVEFLLKLPDIDVRYDNARPLAYAGQYGQYNILKMMLEKVELEESDISEILFWTAVGFSINKKNGYLAIIKLLTPKILEYEIDITYAERWLELKHINLTEILIKNEIEYNTIRLFKPLVGITPTEIITEILIENE